MKGQYLEGKYYFLSYQITDSSGSCIAETATKKYHPFYLINLKNKDRDCSCSLISFQEISENEYNMYLELRGYDPSKE